MSKKGNIKPSLFGLKHSNRDFTQRDYWGKNQFSSSFPVALSSFLASKGLQNIYLTLGKDKKIERKTISTQDLYGISPNSDELYYSFESVYTHYEQLVKGKLPRIDLVTQNKKSNTCLNGLEIKLTALPDNSTCGLTDDKFGSELVIRPDTIVYLACSIALIYKNNPSRLQKFFHSDFDKITDWAKPENILSIVPKIVQTIDKIIFANLKKQSPLLLQSVWKTEGKSLRLAENCLDVFVWSNFAFIELFMNEVRKQKISSEITRQTRTVIWLFKMLYDFSKNHQFDHQKIIDALSYNTKNDKAFSANGNITCAFMKCRELISPRIKKEEIKNIILGGGQNLLSPERRFDATVFNSPELFN